MLFSDAINAYMDDKRRRLRGTTIEGYESAIRCHVAPAWGCREVESVTHDELQSWVDSIPTYGAAEKAFKTFRQVYRWTLRKMQLRIWDVTQGIELPEKPVTHRAVLSAQDEREMLRGVAGQEWEAVVLAAASMGLRPSEAMGLDWSDFDWRGGWCHIRRGAHQVGGEVVEHAPKTRHSDRWLKVPRFALERLRALRGRVRSGRLRGEMSPSQVKGRFRRFCRRFGLPALPMQNLRHTWATLSIEAGAALADVAVYMGHTSVDMVRDHYLQSTRAVVRRAVAPYEGAIISEDDTSVQTLRSFADLHVRASGDEVELTCASGLWSGIVQSSKVALHIPSHVMTY